MLDAAEAKIREMIGLYIYSTTPGESYEAVLVRRLHEEGVTLAVVESNTRGTLADRLANADPAYQPVLLRQVIDLEQVRTVYAGAAGGTAQPISDSHMMQQAAIIAAQEARSQAGAAIGLALVGTAGADEGVFGARSGETSLALAGGLEGEDRLETVHIAYGGQDDYTITRIGNEALRSLWKFVG